MLYTTTSWIGSACALVQVVVACKLGQFSPVLEVVGQGSFMGKFEFEQYALGIDQVDELHVPGFVPLTVYLQRLFGLGDEAFLIEVDLAVGVAQFIQGLLNIGIKGLLPVFEHELCGGSLIIGGGNAGAVFADPQRDVDADGSDDRVLAAVGNRHGGIAGVDVLQTEGKVGEAFALVREVADRKLGMRHFDVQLVGGWAMLSGMMPSPSGIPR